MFSYLAPDSRLAILYEQSSIAHLWLRLLCRYEQSTMDNRGFNGAEIHHWAAPIEKEITLYFRKNIRKNE